MDTSKPQGQGRSPKYRAAYYLCLNISLGQCYCCLLLWWVCWNHSAVAAPIISVNNVEAIEFCGPARPQMLWFCARGGKRERAQFSHNWTIDGDACDAIPVRCFCKLPVCHTARSLIHITESDCVRCIQSQKRDIDCHNWSALSLFRYLLPQGCLL